MLTDDELSHGRETASFRRLFNLRAADARRIILDNHGLSPVYAHDPAVHAAFQFCLKGAATLHGALLLAYRALAHRELPLEVPPRTLETIEPQHVIWLSAVCAVVRQNNQVRADGEKFAGSFSVPSCL